MLKSHLIKQATFQLLSRAFVIDILDNVKQSISTTAEFYWAMPTDRNCPPIRHFELLS